MARCQSLAPAYSADSSSSSVSEGSAALPTAAASAPKLSRLYWSSKNVGGGVSKALSQRAGDSSEPAGDDGMLAKLPAAATPAPAAQSSLLARASAFGTDPSLSIKPCKPLLAPALLDSRLLPAEVLRDPAVPKAAAPRDPASALQPRAWDFCALLCSSVPDLKQPKAGTLDP